MYVNKCTKCGAEFETKNPKRVICPNCLYPDKKAEGEADSSSQGEEQRNFVRSYSAGTEDEGYNKRPYQQNRPNNYRDNRNSHNQQGGYRQNNRPNNNFNNRRPNNNQRFQGGYNNSQRPQQNRFNKQGGQRQGGGFNNNRRPAKRPNQQKQLLISKDQLAQIELLYKKVLPLPNPDIHEVIGQALGIEPRKVFFGINLIRQKLFLPKLPFPKRKLAVSAEQLSAIKMLYEPLLPLPPIGCHKIIAIQLKMDEWRVHVGIGIVRKQMGLDRWNEGRPDAPPSAGTSAAKEEPAEDKKAKKTTKKTKEKVEKESSDEESAPKKRTRKKKTDDGEEA